MPMVRPGSRHMLLAALALAWTGAATGAPVRTILEQSDLPATAQTVRLGRVTLAPGEEIAWHIHPGIEIGYVVSGALALSSAGAPDRTVTAGQSFLVPRGVTHRSRAVGSAGAVLSVTWITDTGLPFSQPAGAPAR